MKKNPSIASAATEEKILIDQKQEQGAGKIQELLSMDDDTVRKRINVYYKQLNFGPPDHKDFGPKYDGPQLTKVLEQLALYRIKAYESSLTGKEPDIAQLKVKYPPAILQDKGYFKHYEKSLEWYFHPEQYKLAGLDDYQWLVLYDDGYYGDWDYYRLTYHTYEADLDYVRYCAVMSKETKWIEDKMGAEKHEWWRYESRAFMQALEIAAGFPNIFAESVIGGFREYINSIEFDFCHCKDFDGVYLEIWKRVAKDKMSFNAALEQLYEQNMFPSRKMDIELALQNYRPIFSASMKDNYDKYVACIDEKISEDEARALIIEAVKKMFPKHKSYLDYARKKLGIAACIGLNSKSRSQEITAQGMEDNGNVKRAIAKRKRCHQ